MADILDIDPMQKFMAMFVGTNGSGKSVAIGSFKDKGSIYYFDFDGRMASVANWYKQRGLRPGQLQYDTYGPHNLYQAMTKLDSFVDKCPHAAIVIDSFTAVTVTAVMYSLRKREMAGGKSVASRSKGDMILPDWDEYKGEVVCVTQMLDLCKSIAAQGTAVVWTAHPIVSTKITGKDYSLQTRYAAYGGKTDSLIPIYFDEIYNFVTEWDPNTDTIKRYCLTQPMAGVNAKTALNLPAKIEWTDKNFYQTFKELAAQGQEEATKKGEEYNALNPQEQPKSISEF